MKIDNKELLNAIKLLNENTSKKDIRPVLTGIHLKYNTLDNFITLESTNTYRATIIKLEIEEPYNNDIDIIFKTFKTTALKKTTGVIEFDPEALTLNDFTGNKILLNLIEDASSYPDINNALKSTLNAERDFKISFKVSELKELINGINKDDIIEFNFNTSNKYQPTLLNFRSGNNYTFKDLTQVMSPCRDIY